MNQIKYLKAKHIDYCETVAEEINMSMGLQTKVNEEGTITVDTVAGPLAFNPIFKDLMQDFYRFMYCYGSKLATYGIEKRIEVANKTFNTKEK
jgi:hypothetical protein